MAKSGQLRTPYFVAVSLLREQFDQARDDAEEQDDQQRLEVFCVRRSVPREAQTVLAPPLRNQRLTHPPTPGVDSLPMRMEFWR